MNHPAALGVATMGAREILAMNLRALLDAHVSINSTPQLERATERLGCKVGKSTIDRALKQQTPLNLDYIAVIAAVFDMDPWQLLVQDLHPKNPPVLRSIGKAEDALYRKFEALVDEAAAVRGKP